MDPLRRLGHAGATRIGGGMEGEVYRIGDGRVAKVWKHAASVAPLQAFYAELAAAEPGFATPEIVEVHTVDGTAVSIERELPGRPLTAAMAEGTVTRTGARRLFLEVLTGLAYTRAGAATRALPVMNEQSAFRGEVSWPSALLGLIDRRVGRFGPQLAATVTDFATKVDRTKELVAQLPAAEQIVHGDICPENILVDECGHLAAVLDWGFLTTAGDAAFDASTAAAFFTMYGASAREDDDALFAELAPVHGPERLLLYRAVYGLVGSNAYDPAGDDGHFEWCVDQLNREDVSELLRSTPAARHR